MANVGYISLHRKIRDCVLWEDKDPFDRRSAWIDLLLLANHSDKKIIFNGKAITIKEGQYLTSVRKLADNWHWSINRTQRYLGLLENENMIERKSDNHSTLITIVNYGFYQHKQYTDEHAENTHTDTDIDTQRDTQTDAQTEHTQIHGRTINNNDNNVNNDNNDNKEKDIPPKSPKTKSTKEPSLTREQMESMVAESDLRDCVKEELNIFIQYKIERGDKYTSTGFSRLIKQIAKYCLSHGENNVIDCMELSMSNNWQGIIWEKIKQLSGAEKFLYGEELKTVKEEPQEEPIEDDDEIWSDERWEEEFKKRGL